MAVEAAFIRHVFSGGWATDFGASIDIPPDQSLLLPIPFLTRAENVVYSMRGGVEKMPGLAKLNAAALESGAAIKGIYDYWIQGGSGTPLQKRILHVGTKVKKDDADATFTDILTGMTAGAPPVYAVLNDILVMVNGSDAPKSWDGSTAQNLAGTPPTGLAWVVVHRNRMFGGGHPANPSRVHYTVAGNPEDWVGAGSGSIDVDTDDGDKCVGAISYKGELIIFKGPHRGSIHRLAGSSSSDFIMDPFIHGVGAVHQNTIFRYLDDVGFIDCSGLVRSLNATASYGDLTSATLSLPINSWIDGNVNFSRLAHAKAIDWPARGLILLCLPISGSQDANTVLAMDYRLETQSTTFEHGQTRVRWAHWKDLDTQAVSMALVSDPSDSAKKIPMFGGSDGFVRRGGRPERSIDGSEAINYVVKTPSFTYATPIIKKTIHAGSIGFTPHGAGNVTFLWTRDNNTQQSQQVSQQGFGDVLGPASLNPFTLDTSELAGEQFVDSFFELHEGGDFRSISYEVDHSVVSENIEINSVSSAVQPGSWSTEN